MKWILRPTLENKTIAVSERGLTSAQWSIYNTDTKRTQYSSEPSSDITATMYNEAYTYGYLNFGNINPRCNTLLSLFAL